MRKVFAFIVSPLKNASNTYTIMKILLDRLVEFEKNIKYDIFITGEKLPESNEFLRRVAGQGYPGSITPEG